MRFAEWMTIVVGLVGIGIAVMLSRFDIHSLLDLTIELFGLLGGGFAGAYTLGMFTRRANSPGVAIGIVAASCLTLVAWSSSSCTRISTSPISIVLSIVIGYVASLFFPAPTRSLEGLTVYADGAHRRARCYSRARATFAEGGYASGRARIARRRGHPVPEDLRRGRRPRLDGRGGAAC